jgi:hypothetical protein
MQLLAKTPEESNYTYIQERILHPEASCLRQFAGLGDEGIPLGLQDYVELVDWAGREIKRNKRVYILKHTPPRSLFVALLSASSKTNSLM